jgi:hypothetical protein
LNKVTVLRVVVRLRYTHARWFHCDNWFTRLRFRMLHPVMAAEFAELRRIARSGRTVIYA